MPLTTNSGKAHQQPALGAVLPRYERAGRDPSSCSSLALHCVGHQKQPSCMPPIWSSTCHNGQRPAAARRKGSLTPGASTAQRRQGSGHCKSSTTAAVTRYSRAALISSGLLPNSLGSSFEQLHTENPGGDGLRVVNALYADVPTSSVDSQRHGSPLPALHRPNAGLSIQHLQ